MAWEIKRASQPEAVRRLLSQGWEPFAVVENRIGAPTIWFKNRKAPTMDDPGVDQIGGDVILRVVPDPDVDQV